MKPATVLLAISGLLSAVLAVQPGFDKREVVRRVRGEMRPTPGDTQGLDDGEFLIDTSSTLVPAPSDQKEPAIAFDGVNFLVVWTDSRSGSYYDIYGARVSPQGTVLDPSGIVISQAVDVQYDPALAFDGANFLVVWEDRRSGDTYDIYGARVSPAGGVLDPSGIAISQAADNRFYPALAFDGANFLVAWQDKRSGYYDIWGARVSPAGVVLDPDGIVISQAAVDSFSYPALAFDGANFLVVWADCRSGTDDIYGARVTPGGMVLDPAGFVISQAAHYQAFPALAFDGANSLVVWEDGRGTYPDIYGARVTPQGSVLDPSGIAISRAGFSQLLPTLAFDGANFLVVWENEHTGTYECDIYGARVTPQGTVLDSAGFVISQAATEQRCPAVAFDGANFLGVWQDPRNHTCDIYGARVAPGGTVLDPDGNIISQAANYQCVPAPGFDGTNYLVVWTAEQGNRSDIYGARMTPQGTVLDPQGIAISQAANGQWYPTLAFDGANFLVVWEDGRSGAHSDIYGARVSPAGAVLDTAGIVISAAASWQESPAVAFDGTNFLVVWYDSRSGSSYDIYGARVTPQGMVLDNAGFVISQATYSQYYPALAFDGASFLVVWDDYRGNGYDIYGARVTPQGTVLDTAGIVISQAEDYQQYPALGFDGTNFLAVWEDYRNRNDTADIYGARVTPLGTVLDPDGIVVSQAEGYQQSPALGFDGADFLVVWEDDRSGGFYSDIYGARVTRAGVVSDEGPVIRQECGQYDPKLARGSGSQMFLVYCGWAGTVGGKTYNTCRIWGKMDPMLGIEEAMDEERGTPNLGSTIIRGVLRLPVSPSTVHTALFDMAGRQVLALLPGPNDVRALAPGVYFVMEQSVIGSQQSGPTAVRKVVIAR